MTEGAKGVVAGKVLKRDAHGRVYSTEEHRAAVLAEIERSGLTLLFTPLISPGSRARSRSMSITRAEGYLEFGLYKEAEAELDNLEGNDRACKEVWVLRCKIYQATENWEAMREVAKHLVSLAPDVAEYWLWAALATRKAENVEAAAQILRFALKYLPADAMIQYHLACYASQLGRLKEARDRLKVALNACGDLKHKATQDPDLEPMWASVGV